LPGRASPGLSGDTDETAPLLSDTRIRRTGCVEKAAIVVPARRQVKANDLII